MDFGRPKWNYIGPVFAASKAQTVRVTSGLMRELGPSRPQNRNQWKREI